MVSDHDFTGGSILRATVPLSVRKRRPSWQQGRQCAHAGCTTRMSIYNQAAMCWVHQGVTHPAGPSSRPVMPHAS